MDYFPYLILSIGLIIFVLRPLFSCKDLTCLERVGDSILVRATPYARLMNDQKLKVKCEDIVKLQLAGSCISLFSASGNAIDIWLDKKSVNTVLESAVKYFPNANLVKIDS